MAYLHSLTHSQLFQPSFCQGLVRLNLLDKAPCVQNEILFSRLFTLWRGKTTLGRAAKKSQQFQFQYVIRSFKTFEAISLLSRLCQFFFSLLLMYTVHQLAVASPGRIYHKFYNCTHLIFLLKLPTFTCFGSVAEFCPNVSSVRPGQHYAASRLQLVLPVLPR